MNQGKGLYPLFGAPFFRSSIFQVDWLHTADKGVTADFLGNFLKLLLTKMSTTTAHDKLRELFMEIQDWYKNHPEVDSKLDNLTKGMIQGKKSSPCLKCKAAEARALVPFAVYASNKWLSDDNHFEAAVKQTARELNACYQQLSQAVYNLQAMKEHSRRFSLLAVGLEAASSGRNWRVKPKLHLFQEMCEMQEGCPSTCWTYRH